MEQMDCIDYAIDVVCSEEGVLERPIKCSDGFIRIGVMQVLSKDSSLDVDSFEGLHMPAVVAKAWLGTQLDNILDTLVDFDWFKELNADRAAIIVAMVREVGLDAFMASPLVKIIAEEDWDELAVVMFEPLWKFMGDHKTRRYTQVLYTGNLFVAY